MNEYSGILREPERAEGIHGADDHVVALFPDARRLRLRVRFHVESLIRKLPEKRVPPQVGSEGDRVAGGHHVHQVVPADLLVAGVVAVVREPHVLDREAPDLLHEQQEIPGIGRRIAGPSAACRPAGPRAIAEEVAALLRQVAHLRHASGKQRGDHGEDRCGMFHARATAR